MKTLLILCIQKVIKWLPVCRSLTLQVRRSHINKIIHFEKNLKATKLNTVIQYELYLLPANSFFSKPAFLCSFLLYCESLCKTSGYNEQRMRIGCATMNVVVDSVSHITKRKNAHRTTIQ